MKPESQKLLLHIARDAIARELDPAASCMPLQADLPAELLEERASFVTLETDGRLRGCIGTLEAYRPLVEDVKCNARSAAFQDPRFPPVTCRELTGLEIHISVLSAPENIPFSSEADLLGKIRPGIDGMILEDGFHRGTFLPSVWKQLPDKRQFLAHLKQKAGLPPAYWSENLKAYRYTAEYFGD